MMARNLGLALALTIAAGAQLTAQCSDAPWDSSLAPASVTRVVGPGTPEEFDGSGFLANWKTYVANGVLSEYGYLAVYSYFIDSVAPGFDYSGTLYVYVNGFLEAFVSVPNSPLNWKACVAIKTEHVKFARRKVGQSPDPVENTITFWYTKWPLANQVDFVADRLSIKAMAPVVLVHGWNAGPWVWGPTPATQADCGVNVADPSDGGQNFIATLKAAKIPYDCRLGIPAQASTGTGAERLRTDQTGLLNTLGSFGAQHVNLVTHSKGGLYARQFLAENDHLAPEERIGVTSLSTLDTPHHGSVLADWVWAERSQNTVLYRLLQISLPWRAFEKAKGAIGPGADDLTVAQAAEFNDKYSTPPANILLEDGSYSMPKYYSISADADASGDGWLSTSEAAPYNLIIANWNYRHLLKIRKITLTKDSSGRTTAIYDRQEGHNIFPNDTAVTVDSARYPTFLEIASYVGKSNARNHATVRRGDVAETVLDRILDAERQQP
jgi:hypothetical protein